MYFTTSRFVSDFQAEDYRRIRNILISEEKSNDVAQLLEPLHQLTEVLLNRVTCRRKPLLAYFDEVAQEKCGACDNCLGGWKTWTYQDVTVDAFNALHLLSQMCQMANHPHWTESNLAAAIRGERSGKFNKLGVTTMQGFGCQFAQASGKNATRSEIIEFLLLLINKKVIAEYKIYHWYAPNHYAQNHIYIKVSNGIPGHHFISESLNPNLQPGPKAQEVFDGKYTIEIPIIQPALPLAVVQEIDPNSGKTVDIHIVDVSQT